MALEKIKDQEEQLKQIMIYAGRPGLWGDWQRFQAKARIARREAEQAAIRKRKKIIDLTIIVGFSVSFLAIFVSFIVLLAHHQSKF